MFTHELCSELHSRLGFRHAGGVITVNGCRYFSNLVVLSPASVDTSLFAARIGSTEEMTGVSINEVALGVSITVTFGAMRQQGIKPEILYYTSIMFRILY